MSAIKRIEDGGSGAGQAGGLPAPRLFQARDGILDLQTLHPDDPVVVTVLATGAQAGDELVVAFGDQRVPYTVQNPRMRVYDVLIAQASLPPAGADYGVQWFRGEKASPILPVYLTDASRSQPQAGPTSYHGSAEGLYGPGLLDAWLVVAPYQLKQAEPVVRTLAGTAPAQAVSLPIGRQPSGGQASMIGTITFDPEAQAWAIEMNADIDLARNDLLSITVPEGAAQYCNFAFAI